jgi:hypothetical protein
LKQLVSADLIPEDEDGRGVEVTPVVEGKVGSTVVGKKGGGANVMVATVVWEDGGATEESVRLGFCPGNVRTGSCNFKFAHSS